MNKIKLVVYNEYALGYIMPETPNKVSTLADNVIKGAPLRTICEPYYISSKDKVRLASKKDFNNFRVCFEGYDNPEIYEYGESDNYKIRSMEKSNKSALICPNCKSTDVEVIDNEEVAICHCCWMEWPYISE